MFIDKANLDLFELVKQRNFTTYRNNNPDRVIKRPLHLTKDKILDLHIFETTAIGTKYRNVLEDFDTPYCF